MNNGKDKQMKNNKGCFRKLPLVAILLLVGLLILPFLGSYLIVSGEVEYSNTIVVLSGGDESRIQEAINLYNEGYSSLIILTETGEVVEGFEHLNSFDKRIELLNNGIPSGNIILTDIEATSTEDEADAVKQVLNNRQLLSCIVVTDPYHTRRTYEIFEDTFVNSEVKIIIRPTQEHWFSPNIWFLSLRGWKFTFLEYLKLIYYQFVN